MNNHHLFFSPMENSDIVLSLELSDLKEKSEPFSIPVKPVWFDRELQGEDKPFKMGVKFSSEKMASVLSKILNVE